MPRIAAAGPFVYVSYYCPSAPVNFQSPNSAALVLTRSADYGASWKRASVWELKYYAITTNGCGPNNDCDWFNFNPSLAAVNNQVFIAFTNEVWFPPTGAAYAKIFLAASYDTGATWKAPVMVSSMPIWRTQHLGAGSDTIQYVTWILGRERRGTRLAGSLRRLCPPRVPWSRGEGHRLYGHLLRAI
jgi:hypothetical protein